MWIVMTSSAKPKRGYGRYMNVALVQLTPHATAWGLQPSRIDARDRRVHRVVHLGRHFVGKTKESAFHRVFESACARKIWLNSNAGEVADSYSSWGGSA